jgi:hypothetical protein
MATSVNTIMMYEENWFNDENNDKKPQTSTSSNHNSPTQSPKRPSQVQANTTWADRISKAHSSPSPETKSLRNNADAQMRRETDDIKADLDRRNLEVESLKEEVRNLKNERIKQNEDLASEVQRQVQLALQEHFEKISTPMVTSSQFEALLNVQAQQFQEFSEKILQRLQHQAARMPDAESEQGIISTTGKCSAAMSDGTSSMTDSCCDLYDDCKQKDTKPTPRKLKYPEATFHSPDDHIQRHHINSPVQHQTEVDMSDAESVDTPANALTHTEMQDRVQGSSSESDHGTRFISDDLNANPQTQNV